jgi:HEXXH motif-containing protein
VLGVLEPATIDANVEKLLLYMDVDPAGSSQRAAYVQALNRIQPIALPAPPDDGDLPWVLTFTADEPSHQAALRYAVTDDTGSTSDELDLLTPSEAADVQRHLRSALEILRAYDPNLAAAAVKLNSWFLFARKPGVIGGSSGGMMGLVWLNPPVEWDDVDHAESLLHETTHQALFLDDLLHKLFARSIASMDSDPDATVTSAIRRTRRRFDLAFHAACVAVELVGLHEHLGLKERAEAHREGAFSSIEELEQRLDLFTEHGLSVFEDLKRSLGATLAAR